MEHNNYANLLIELDKKTDAEKEISIEYRSQPSEKIVKFER